MNNRTISGALISLFVLFLGAALAQEDNSSNDRGIAITNANFVAPSPEKDNLNDEWVEIANRGTIDSNLTGWTIKDAQNHTFTFPDLNLMAGATVKIHTGKGSNSDKDVYWNRNSPVWNNDGDTATLADAAGLTVSCYPDQAK